VQVHLLVVEVQVVEVLMQDYYPSHCTASWLASAVLMQINLLVLEVQVVEAMSMQDCNQQLRHSLPRCCLEVHQGCT
jgi:hypothetical protein